MIKMDGKMKSWSVHALNKGETMGREWRGCAMTIEHVDRTIDPYLAGVIKDGKIIYSGLHSSVSSARLKCERIVDVATT